MIPDLGLQLEIRDSSLVICLELLLRGLTLEILIASLFLGAAVFG